MKLNDRVIIAEPGVPEEQGTVVGMDKNGTVCVLIDKRYRIDKRDDGLRDCTPEQLKFCRLPKF